MLTTTVLLTLLCSNALLVHVATSPVDSSHVDSMADVITDADSVDCVRPSDDELVRIFTGTDTFLAYIPDEESDNTKVNGSLPEELSASLENSLHCPIGEKITESSPLRFRGVCPWELLDDFDSNRFPKTIQKAVCRCTNCLDPKTNQPNEKLSCQPVTYPMPVLRRTGCKDGVATYAPNFEHVPVACDCIAKRKKNIDNGVKTMTM